MLNLLMMTRSLSYPYVFAHENDYYMLPESSEAGGVFLYKSNQFPYNWERGKQLLSGSFVDPTLFYHETEYEEEVIKPGLLTGSDQEGSWRKDGMHHIDHLQTEDNKWLIAVDGHFMKEQNYLIWKARRFMNRPFYSSYKLSRHIIRRLQLIVQLWL